MIWSIYDDDKYESQCTAPEEEEPEEDTEADAEAEVVVDRKLHEWIDEGKPEEEDILW